jgi:hypothetical protein
MPRNLHTPKGEPSFDGVHPKTLEFSGVTFGYHKKEQKCVMCSNFTHFSLHRKYKGDLDASSLERNEQCDRLWICSDKCWKEVVYSGIFSLAIPVGTANRILNY